MSNYLPTVFGENLMDVLMILTATSSVALATWTTRCTASTRRT